MWPFKNSFPTPAYILTCTRYYTELYTQSHPLQYFMGDSRAVLTSCDFALHTGFCMIDSPKRFPSPGTLRLLFAFLLLLLFLNPTWSAVFGLMFVLASWHVFLEDSQRKPSPEAGLAITRAAPPCEPHCKLSPWPLGPPDCLDVLWPVLWGHVIGREGTLNQTSQVCSGFKAGLQSLGSLPVKAVSQVSMSRLSEPPETLVLILQMWAVRVYVLNKLCRGV